MSKRSDASKRLQEKIRKMNEKRLKPKPTRPLELLNQRRKALASLIAKKCKKSHLLVLDLDGTLISYGDPPRQSRQKENMEAAAPQKDRRRRFLRPHFQKFMEQVSKNFDIVVFTMGTESHLRYFLKKYFGNYANVGLSRRWMHKNLKDIVPFLTLGKAIAFVDDDNRHYKFQSYKFLIEIPRWTAEDTTDEGLLDALGILKARFPECFPTESSSDSSSSSESK